MTPLFHIGVGQQPLNIPLEYGRLRGGGVAGKTGATAMFVGTMRGAENDKLFLEHYPQMTEGALQNIAAAAAEKWQLLQIRIVHRVGALRAGEEIVFVGVCAAHRAAAFAACEFIVDFLKSRAPFWKKETTAAGEKWVAAAAADEAALLRWAGGGDA